MADQSIQKVAVVGYNISALKALRALKKTFPQLELKWLLAAKDMSTVEQNNWLCIPDQIFKTFEWDATLGRTLPTQWFVHFEDYDHEPLESFVHNPRRRKALQIPLALRKKIENLSLWNDLTPRAWTPQAGVDCNWTFKEAVSLPERNSKHFHLINRKQLLETQSPVRPDIRHRAMGVDEGESRNTHKIIYNAPFGSESFDRVLWTSHTSRVRLENDADYKIKPLSNLPLGRWRSWTARVPEKYTSFLKPASIWLDSGEHGKFFLSTGIFRTACLHRVLTCSTAKSADLFPAIEGGELMSDIQIETLEFFSEPLSTKTDFRPDTFLWKYSPFLQTLNSSVWSENSLDENWIYADPFPILHHFARGIDFWSGGAFSNISRLIELNALWPGLKINPALEKSVSPKIDTTP